MSAITLRPLELASGVVFGDGPVAAAEKPAPDPQTALARTLAAALSRPPCVVSFSGGGDSSAVLAAAVKVAREQGLAEPIPVTLRFPGVASADESGWQESVIAHLGVADWVRIEVHTELDFLGDIARAAVRRHGLLWPANAHFHVPVFERAAGGTVLTGVDGDGLLGGWRWQRAQAVLTRAARPQLRDALRVALAVAPLNVRAAVLARRQPLPISWLRAQSQNELAAALAREAASEPRDWPTRVAWFARRRYLQLGVLSLAALAADHNVQVVHPLLDPGYLAALATDGGPAGYGDRIEATRRLFGELLPAAVVQRRTKAEFGAALWGPRTRAFAADWDGTGVDSDLIDQDQLRAAWSGSNPPLGAATVLQHAWLESQRMPGGTAS